MILAIFELSYPESALFSIPDQLMIEILLELYY